MLVDDPRRDVLVDYSSGRPAVVGPIAVVGGSEILCFGVCSGRPTVATCSYCLVGLDKRGQVR